MYQKISNSWLKHWDFMILDLIGIQIAFEISLLIRNGIQSPWPTMNYLNLAVVLCFADICVVFFMESYRGILRRGYFREFKAVLTHVISLMLAELLYLFLTKMGAHFSRLSFLLFVVILVPILFVIRCTWKYFLMKHKKVYYRQKSILVLTTERRAGQVLATIQNNTFNEIRITGVVIMDTDKLVGSKIQGVEVVCKGSEVLDYAQTRWIDSIMINVHPDTHLISEDFMLDCLRMGITVHQELALLGDGSNHQQLERIGGYAVLSTTIRIATARQLFFKRCLDLCGGIVGCLMTGIITIFLAPAIYIASPGPIFFSQTRVGMNGRKFKIYKFRSMYMDAEKRKKELMERNEMQGFMFKLEADPRIIGSGPDGTRHGLGWLIRKTSLDEFPQFWNVLKGDMSLVGTRPPTVDEWEKYSHHHRARMAAKPGITGMWQVSGRSDITDFEEVVRLDTEYIQKWNLGLDVKILLKTVLVVLLGKGSK